MASASFSQNLVIGAHEMPPVLSPVDYDAWNRGYMPPTEHVLIDALAYRGARVVSMSSGSDGAVYVVMQGKSPDKRTRMVLRQLLETFDEIEAEKPEEAGKLADAHSKNPPEAEHG